MATKQLMDRLQRLANTMGGDPQNGHVLLITVSWDDYAPARVCANCGKRWGVLERGGFKERCAHPSPPSKNKGEVTYSMVWDESDKPVIPTVHLYREAEDDTDD